MAPLVSGTQDSARTKSFSPTRIFERITSIASAYPNALALPMDIERHPDHYVLYFDMPGVKTSDIDIDIDGRELRVRALRDTNHSGDVRWHTRERPHGVFSRTFTLSSRLDTTTLEAEYHDGVLEVTIGFKDSEKPMKATIRPSQRETPGQPQAVSVTAQP